MQQNADVVSQHEAMIPTLPPETPVRTTPHLSERFLPCWWSQGSRDDNEGDRGKTLSIFALVINHRRNRRYGRRARCSPSTSGSWLSTSR